MVVLFNVGVMLNVPLVPLLGRQMKQKREMRPVGGRGLLPLMSLSGSGRDALNGNEAPIFLPDVFEACGASPKTRD